MLPRKSAQRKKERIAADPDRSPQHMAWVRRTFVCAAFKSGECEGPNHAHHVRTAANSGVGMKPSDFSVVPLCFLHHQILHDKGQETFEAEHNVNLSAEAAKLAKASPYKVREPRE